MTDDQLARAVEQADHDDPCSSYHLAEVMLSELMDLRGRVAALEASREPPVT